MIELLIERRRRDLRGFSVGRVLPYAQRRMVGGAETVGDRFIEWNFVSSSRQRIEQAKADWRAGRMKIPDGDSDEFIPLPDDAAPANPMS